jgi:hypothetical protein
MRHRCPRTPTYGGVDSRAGSTPPHLHDLMMTGFSIHYQNQSIETDNRLVSQFARDHHISLPLVRNKDSPRGKPIRADVPMQCETVLGVANS